MAFETEMVSLLLGSILIVAATELIFARIMLWRTPGVFTMVAAHVGTMVLGLYFLFSVLLGPVWFPLGLGGTVADPVCLLLFGLCWFASVCCVIHGLSMVTGTE